MVIVAGKFGGTSHGGDSASIDLGLNLCHFAPPLCSKYHVQSGMGESLFLVLPKQRNRCLPICSKVCRDLVGSIAVHGNYLVIS